jgi:hypothetical protein
MEPQQNLEVTHGDDYSKLSAVRFSTLRRWKRGTSLHFPHERRAESLVSSRLDASDRVKMFGTAFVKGTEPYLR